MHIPYLIFTNILYELGQNKQCSRNWNTMIQKVRARNKKKPSRGRITVCGPTIAEVQLIRSLNFGRAPLYLPKSIFKFQSWISTIDTIMCAILAFLDNTAMWRQPSCQIGEILPIWRKKTSRAQNA